MDEAVSCRGLAIAVRDEGSVSGVQFTNISVEALFFERSWNGAAEPIHITAMPRNVGTKVRHRETCLGFVLKGAACMPYMDLWQTKHSQHANLHYFKLPPCWIVVSHRKQER